MSSEQTKTSAVKTITAKALATRLGIGTERIRQILMAEYPRDVKKKKWEIPMTLAKKVERDYKAKVEEREAKKKAQIDNELKGKS